MRVSSRAVGVVDVNRILDGQLPLGGYSTGILATIAADPADMKAA